MKTMSKVAVALVGAAGLAMAAETAQAATVVINGAGSSAGRQFASLSPAFVCDTPGTPLYFKDTGNPPNRSEWQCKVGGVDHIFRYFATASTDGFAKLPSGALGTTTYLDTSVCSGGGSATVGGRTVTQTICTAGTLLPSPQAVHWGGSDVKASSFVIPPLPSTAHLTATPTVVVPFAIAVGANVRGKTSTGALTQLLSMTEEEIRQILAGNVVDPNTGLQDWTLLGFDTTTSDKTIITCQRTVGSGTLATLEQTIMRPKYWSGGVNATPSATNIMNPSSSDVKNCVNNNPNSIGYIDSDTVPTLTGGGVFGAGPYQVAINGMEVNHPGAGTISDPTLTGKDRLKDIRCGKYIYWADWNFVTRNVGVETSPYTVGTNVELGANAAIAALGAAMLNNNPLPNFWLSENDTFVSKNSDRGPFAWFTPTNHPTTPENIGDVCRYAASSK